MTLGLLIAQELGIIGCTTGVFKGTADEWLGQKLVVKLSWPNATRTSEATYLRDVRRTVTGMAVSCPPVFGLWP